MCRTASTPTPTSDFAHLVLPAAIWGAKEGTHTNSERRISKVNTAVEPPGEAHPDFDIFLALASRLGVRNELFPSGTPRTMPSGSGSASQPDAFATTPPTPGSKSKTRAACSGAAPLCTATVRFPHQTAASGSTRFPATLSSSSPNDQYSFILNTGRTVEHWHTRTKTAAIDLLKNMVPHAWLEMNPADATRLNIRAHDRVTVVSRRGAVPNVELRVTEIVAPGQVFMPFHFVETNSNIVTLGAFDPISREPNFKQCAVPIERTQPLSS